MNDIRGTYKHYKGHLYEALGIAKHSETLEVLGVAYQRRDTDEIIVWVRPEAMFVENVVVEGKTLPRFERLPDWADDDKDIPEDALIEAAHPATCENPDHETYLEALRFVSAKRSKYALVDLVNWLLIENKKLRNRK